MKMPFARIVLFLCAGESDRKGFQSHNQGIEC